MCVCGRGGEWHAALMDGSDFPNGDKNQFRVSDGSGLDFVDECFVNIIASAVFYNIEWNF